MLPEVIVQRHISDESTQVGGQNGGLKPGPPIDVMTVGCDVLALLPLVMRPSTVTDF